MHDRLDQSFSRTGISNGTGLRCRAPECAEIFRRDGMGADLRLLLAAAADRDAHELAGHDLVIPKPEPERKYGRGVALRTVVDGHLRVETARRQSPRTADSPVGGR